MTMGLKNRRGTARERRCRADGAFLVPLPECPRAPQRKEGCASRPVHTYRWDFLFSATHPSRSARKHEGIEGDEDAGELLRSDARKSTSNGSQTWSTACGDRSWTERYGLLLRQDGRGTRNAVDLHFFDFQILSLIAVLRHLDAAACERGQASSYCDGYH